MDPPGGVKAIRTKADFDDLISSSGNTVSLFFISMSSSRLGTRCLYFIYVYMLFVCLCVSLSVIHLLSMYMYVWACVLCVWAWACACAFVCACV